jgi:organic hydroperoxide reductase OsmC/OhrA
VGDGFSVAVDEPVSVGGTEDAPQPTDLFLASVASCFALALVYSARKQSIALGSVRVAVVGDYGAGCRFDAVHVEAEVVGPTAAEIDALRTAAERVCYVTNTLRSPVTLTVTAGPPADESQ